MEDLLSECQQALEKYSRERENTQSRPNNETIESVLAELRRFQKLVGQNYAQAEDRNKKQILYALDVNIDKEIDAWAHFLQNGKEIEEPKPPLPIPSVIDFHQTPTRPPNEYQSYMENLLIELRLNYSNEYDLSLYQRNFKDMFKRAKTTKDSMPFIIGLIGDTHGGKSAMIYPLLQNLTAREMKQMVIDKEKIDESEDKKYQGNSANICIHSTGFSDEATTIYVLDMEGTNANHNPSMLEHAIKKVLSITPPGALQTTLKIMLSDPVQRNQAVEKLIPSFAYLVCDMIIYISTDTLDNSRFIERVTKFTKNFKQVNDRPSLVLISNKLNVTGTVFDINESTKKFCDVETNNESGNKIHVGTFLKSWYSSVTCVCLPNWKEARYVDPDDPNSLAMESIGAIKFIQQIESLKKHIVIEFKKRKNLRADFGISEKTFLILLKDFIKNNYVLETKRLLDYYSFTISNVSGEVDEVYQVFQQLLNRINLAVELPDNIISNYNKVCRFAMIYLAIRISLRVRLTIDAPIYVTTIEPNWTKNYEELINLLKPSELCFDRVTYRLLDGNLELKKTFRCTNTRKLHSSGDTVVPHFCHDELFAPDASWSYIKKWSTQLWAYLGYGYYPRWEGEFIPHDDMITENALSSEFTKAVRQVFEKHSKEECIKYAIMLLKSLTNDNPIQVTKTAIDGDSNMQKIYCSICFTVGEKLCKTCEPLWNSAQIEKEWRLRFNVH